MSENAKELELLRAWESARRVRLALHQPLPWEGAWAPEWKDAADREDAAWFALSAFRDQEAADTRAS